MALFLAIHATIARVSDHRSPSAPQFGADPPTLVRFNVACLIALMVFGLAGPLAAQETQQAEVLAVAGLQQPVEILKDRWGISHIYAQTEHDLFFAQGFNAARDRLFQLEVWRRQATGTVAEILGPRHVTHDHGARLFQLRVDIEQEMRHYHDRGDQIIPAFVAGINAYIDKTRDKPELLPIEFELLGIQPEHWTPEVVVSRHQGLLGDADIQLSIGRAVHLLGEEQVKRIHYFHPHQPDLTLDPAIDGQHLVDHDILRLYHAYRGSINFRPENIVATHRNDLENYQRLAQAVEEEREIFQQLELESIGSNNWVVSGRLAQNDYPMMANDPHRAHQAPPLRYWVHLNGPGWNVIGGGEPAIPGISIGHNGFGAWGLTIFGVDHEDIYVYQTHPEDPDRYLYQGRWLEMGVIPDTIEVKGEDPRQVALKYTRHGPVVYEDPEANVAYAVRAAWLEAGGAPYLSSLRMNQAQSWEEFRQAVTYNHIPAENMVWADRAGDIGWQAGGIAPIRRNFSGLVPVPGDGRYEWDGYLPIVDLPHAANPAQGYIATANANLTSPFDYEYLDEAICFLWSAPYRQARVNEFLSNGRRISMMDMVKLQHDYLSIPARTLVPLLKHIESEDPQVERARQRLLDWDYVLDPDSIEAGIYVAFQRRMRQNIQPLFVPRRARGQLSVGMSRMIDFLLAPPGEFGENPIVGRDEFMLQCLEEGVQWLQKRFGPDMDQWQYGQANYKHALIRHPLSSAVNGELRRRLDVGPAPRGGDSFTVGNTGSGNNQTSGASFRIFVDTRNWDATLGMNTPGQSGDPDSPFYNNLFDLWANDRLFPVFYSRERIEQVTAERIELAPAR